MLEEEIKIQLPKLRKRIPYEEEIIGERSNYESMLKDLLEDSKSIMLETLYPFEDDYTDIKIPKSKYNWQLRCCVELYNLADKIGFTTYSESGFAWGKLVDGLSNELMWKLTSKVGVPKRKEYKED